MKKPKNFTVVVAIGLLIVLILGFSYIYKKYYFSNAKTYSTYIETYQEYDAAEISTITISNINHKVIIKSSSDDKIKITYFQKIENSNTYSVEGKKIKMELIEKVEDLDNILFKTERKIDVITIAIPLDSNVSITIDSVYGTLTVSDVSLNDLQFSNTNGDILIENTVAGNIILTTNTSTIDLENDSFNRLTIDDVAGAINLHLADSLQLYNVDISSNYGTLLINNDNVYVEDEAGEKTVVSEYLQQIAGATSSIHLKTVRGDISVTSIEPEIEETETESES